MENEDKFDVIKEQTSCLLIDDNENTLKNTNNSKLTTKSFSNKFEFHDKENLLSDSINKKMSITSRASYINDYYNIKEAICGKDFNSKESLLEEINNEINIGYATKNVFNKKKRLNSSIPKSYTFNNESDMTYKYNKYDNNNKNYNKITNTLLLDDYNENKPFLFNENILDKNKIDVLSENTDNKNNILDSNTSKDIFNDYDKYYNNKNKIETENSKFNQNLKLFTINEFNQSNDNLMNFKNSKLVELNTKKFNKNGLSTTLTLDVHCKTFHKSINQEQIDKLKYLNSRRLSQSTVDFIKRNESIKSTVEMKKKLLKIKYDEQESKKILEKPYLITDQVNEQFIKLGKIKSSFSNRQEDYNTKTNEKMSKLFQEKHAKEHNNNGFEYRKALNESIKKHKLEQSKLILNNKNDRIDKISNNYDNLLLETTINKLFDWKEAKKRRIIEKQFDDLKKELKECKFQPVISDSSKKLAIKNKNRNNSTFDYKCVKSTTNKTLNVVSNSNSIVFNSKYSFLNSNERWQEKSLNQFDNILRNYPKVNKNKSNKYNDLNETKLSEICNSSVRNSSKRVKYFIKKDDSKSKKLVSSNNPINIINNILNRVLPNENLDLNNYRKRIKKTKSVCKSIKATKNIKFSVKSKSLNNSLEKFNKKQKLSNSNNNINSSRKIEEKSDKSFNKYLENRESINLKKYYVKKSSGNFKSNKCSYNNTTNESKNMPSKINTSQINKATESTFQVIDTIDNGSFNLNTLDSNFNFDKNKKQHKYNIDTEYNEDCYEDQSSLKIKDLISSTTSKIKQLERKLLENNCELNKKHFKDINYTPNNVEKNSILSSINLENIASNRSPTSKSSNFKTQNSFIKDKYFNNNDVRNNCIKIENENNNTVRLSKYINVPITSHLINETCMTSCSNQNQYTQSNTLSDIPFKKSKPLKSVK